MDKKVSENNAIKRYTVIKIGLGVLFVCIMASCATIAYKLFTDGITVGRLVLLAALMVASYIGGACHGSTNRQIEKMKEEQK